MKKTAFLVSLAFLGVASQARAMEGHWPWSRVQAMLNRDGFVKTVTNCRDTNSYVAQHCTIDFQNSDGVRISVAVRNTFDNRPDYVYRIVCTASCSLFRGL